MTPGAAVTQLAAFVPGKVGSRFRLVSEPSDSAVCGTIIFVPGFAEEMNKSRRMAARMARLFAADGWRVVQRDLCGCGDSSGDFAGATWESWVDDVEAEVTAAQPSLPIWIWGLRAGALLIPPVIAKRLDANILLWQPVMSGAQHLQQFLRLHAGARIVRATDRDREASPANLLRSGQFVEIAGYQLNPALASGLDKAIFDLPTEFSGRVVWFELSADEAPQMSPQAVRAIERLSANGHLIESAALQGPPFWQTLEIEECEALLEHSLNQVRSTANA